MDTKSQVLTEPDAAYAREADNQQLARAKEIGSRLRAVGAEDSESAATLTVQDQTTLVTVGGPVPMMVESQVPGFDFLPVTAQAAATVSVQQIRKISADGLRPGLMIVNNRQPWLIRFHWRIGGTTAELLTGTWILGARLERLDAGIPDVKAYSAGRQVALVRSDDHEYDKFICVDACSVPDGFYRLAAWLDLEIPAPGHAPICGAVDGSILRLVGAMK